VYIFRTAIEIINGISSAVSTSVTGVSLAGGRILDFKFLNDSSLLLLWAAQGESNLLLSV
jgi:anaphase-promoting complex subunit 4